MLTVVIPTVMRPTLKRAKESVTKQTLPCELVVVADPNRVGAGPTRNKGIKMVTTNWVGFLDDDDELDEHYHEWLEKYKDDSDLVIFMMKNQPNGGIPNTTKVEELAFNQVGISFALKTKLAKKFRFYNMIGEDYQFILRVKEAGYKIKIVPKIAYYVKGREGCL